MNSVMCVQVREMLAETMHRLVERVTGDKIKAEEVFNERAELSQHQCYKAAVNHYKHNCFNWHKTEVGLHSCFLLILKQPGNILSKFRKCWWLL